MCGVCMKPFVQQELLLNLSATTQTLFLSAVALSGLSLPAQAANSARATDSMNVLLESKGLARTADTQYDELDVFVRTNASNPNRAQAQNAGKTSAQIASMDDFVQQQILRLPQPVVAEPSNHGNGWIKPVSNYRKSSDYGYRRHPVLKKVKFHTGVDYSAPAGTPIYAADSGLVEFAGRKGAYGKTVVIKHDERFSTLYGHASKYVVQAGQRVQRGQLIAYVGSTGRSTGPHLHFEVFDGTKRVNPNKFF